MENRSFKYVQLSLSFFLSLVIVFCGLKTNADEKPYLSGDSLKKTYSEIVKNEGGLSIRVPIDYKDHSKGMTPIYFFFLTQFNPNKPTIAIFTGGPGGAAHGSTRKANGQFSYADANILMFDQRGIGFSRPEERAMFENPDFYDSEATARDLDEIRKYLKIQKIIVFGGSYGTVPATIYGSLFEKNTIAVLFEGTFFGGFDFYYRSNILPTKIQSLFNSLPADVREKINLFSDTPSHPVGYHEEINGSVAQSVDTSIFTFKNRTFFPTMTKSILGVYGDLDFNIFSAAFLEATSELNLESAQKVFIEKINKLFATKSERKPSLPEELTHANPAHFILNCKELGMYSNDFSDTIELAENTIRWVDAQTASSSVPKNSYLSSCRHYLPIEKIHLFDSTKWPLRVPVTYFQGESDPATLLIGATEHYKKVALGPKQMLVFKQGGHGPIGQFLSVANESQKKFLTVILSQDLMGREIHKLRVDQFNSVGRLKVDLLR